MKCTYCELGMLLDKYLSIVLEESKRRQTTLQVWTAKTGKKSWKTFPVSVILKDKEFRVFKSRVHCIELISVFTGRLHSDKIKWFIAVSFKANNEMGYEVFFFVNVMWISLLHTIKSIRTRKYSRLSLYNESPISRAVWTTAYTPKLGMECIGGHK